MLATLIALALPTALATGHLTVQSSAAFKLDAPAGWKTDKQEGVLILEPPNVPEGKLLKVLVPPLATKPATLQATLDAGKLVLGDLGKFKPLVEPKQGKSSGGWDYLLVVGSLENPGATLLAQVLGYKKGSDAAIVLVLSDSLETMQQHQAALSAMINGVGGKPAPPAIGSGTVDLRYSVPAGWERKPVGGAVMLEKWVNKDDDMYGTRALYRLLIGPTETLNGSLKANFVAHWSAMVTPNYKTSIVPLPMMRRLKSGLAVAYDGDGEAVASDGAKVYCNLYIVNQGDKVVPVMGMFAGGVNDKIEPEILALFESMRIPGASDKRNALFSSADIAGNWTSSSASYASYVTPSGGYGGDASVATGSYLNLLSSGKFDSTFIGVSSSTRLKEQDAGTWKIVDDKLVLSGRSPRSYRIFGAGADPKVGAFLVLSMYTNSDEVMELYYPRRPLAGTWMKRKG